MNVLLNLMGIFHRLFRVICLTMVLLLTLSVNLNSQVFSWAKQYNYNNGPFVGKYGGIDAAGNYYAAGKDFIIKHSPAGTVIWVKQFLNFTSVNSSNQIYAIAVDAAGNVFIAGGFVGTYDFDLGPGVNNLASSGYTDGFVERLDANGNFVWAGPMGGPGVDNFSTLCLDGAGNVCLTGRYGYMGPNTSYADFDPGVGQYIINSVGNYDKFVEKLDGAGNFIWANSYGGPQVDAGGQIVADANNNIFLIGSLNGNTVLDKFDPNGNTIWTKQLLASGSCCLDIVDVSIDGSGNLLTTGTFSGTVDFDPGAAVYNLTGPDAQDLFIWKLDNSGNFVWAKRVIGGYSNAGSSITTDGTGNVYTTGFYSGTGNHDFDPGPGTFNFSGSGMFIQKLNSSGIFVWAASIAGTGSAMPTGHSIQLSTSGDIYTSINFSGSVDFNPGKAKYTLNAANGRFVVHKMTQGGGGNKAQQEEPTTEIFLPENVSVYPNPNNGKFTIQLPLLTDDASLVVTDLSGKVVLKQTIKGGPNNISIDLGTKTPGMYLIEIKDGDKRYISKLIVQ